MIINLHDKKISELFNFKNKVIVITGCSVTIRKRAMIFYFNSSNDFRIFITSNSKTKFIKCILYDKELKK